LLTTFTGGYALPTIKPRFTVSTGPIEGLTSTFQDWLYLPDPGPLYAVIGAMVANMLPGDPVWLMLVGPPSSGKTEILWSLRGLPHVFARERVTGEAGLLSGVGKKDRIKDATGGLLREIGEFGVLLMKDFTALLMLPRDKTGELLGAFQDIYDGHWSRNVGAEGGKVLEWSGKMGFLTACTAEIDSHHTLTASMGPRFLFYRLPSSEGEREGMTALMNEDSAEMREALKDAVTEFMTSGGVDEKVKERHTLSQKHMKRLTSMGIVAARARTAIKRDTYSRDVVQPPSPESNARITKGLGQMLRGLRIAGVDDTQTWRVLSRIAVDSLPLLRRRAVMLLSESSQPVALSKVVEATQCSAQATRRCMEDLVLLGVVAIDGKGREFRYELSVWAREKWKQAFPHGVRSALLEEI
jgi:hypothetical protein